MTTDFSRWVQKISTLEKILVSSGDLVFQPRHVIWAIFYTECLSLACLFEKKAMTRVLKNQSTSSAPFVWKHVRIEYHPYIHTRHWFFMSFAFIRHWGARHWKTLQNPLMIIFGEALNKLNKSITIGYDIESIQSRNFIWS